MPRFAHIVDGKVDNIIVADTLVPRIGPGGVLRDPFAGMTLIELEEDADVTPGDLYDGQAFARPGPDVAAIAADYDKRLLQHFDDVATERRYDSRVTCALRAGYPGPFREEGLAFGGWMDACNEVAYGLLAQAMQTGVIPTWDEVLEALPLIAWPD